LIDFQLYPRLLAVFRMQHWKEIKNILKSGNFLTNVCRQFANILPALSQKFHGLFFLKFHLTFVGCCKTPKVTSGNFEVFLVFWIGTTDLSKAKKTKILLQLWVFRPFPSKSGTFLKNIFLKLWSWSKFSVQNRFIQHACASLSAVWIKTTTFYGFATNGFSTRNASQVRGLYLKRCVAVLTFRRFLKLYAHGMLIVRCVWCVYTLYGELSALEYAHICTWSGAFIAHGLSWTNDWDSKDVDDVSVLQ